MTFEGVPCPFAAECRDINVELDRPGEWRMALTIDSPLGKETTQFAVRVTEGGIDIGRYTPQRAPSHPGGAPCPDDAHVVAPLGPAPDGRPANPAEADDAANDAGKGKAGESNADGIV